MTKLRYILISYLVVTCAIYLSGQEQYLNLYLTANGDRNIHLDTNSYMTWGSIDTQHDSSDHILLHQIPKSGNSSIFVNFEAKDSNDVFVGYVKQDSFLYYGALFRNDSCFAFLESGPIFLMSYNKGDSIVIVKCHNDIQLFLNDSVMYAYNLDTFYNDLDVVVQVESAYNTPNMLLAYYLFGACDTLLSPGPEVMPVYLSLNVGHNRSYSVVKGDTLYLRYRERYNITSVNDSVEFKIYGDADLKDPIHTYHEPNNYGNNFKRLDLMSVSGILPNNYYWVVVEGVNKNRKMMLRFYKYEEVFPD